MVAGSVATVKHAELAMALAARGATVKLVATRHAQHMMRVAGDYAPDKVAAFAASGIEVLTDEAEWEGYESGEAAALDFRLPWVQRMPHATAMMQCTATLLFTSSFGSGRT